MNDDVGPLLVPGPSAQALSLEQRYHALAIELFGEAVIAMARVIRSPEAPRGRLTLTLEQLVSALREEPHRITTQYELALQARTMDLLHAADASVNGPDTQEGRARLYSLVSELKSLGR